MRMCNSIFSSKRFLGDNECLSSLIERDAATLVKNNVTHTELANAICGVVDFCADQPLMVRGDAPYSYKVKATYLRMSDKVSFKISSVTHMGYQSCPFENCLNSRPKFNGEGVGNVIATIAKYENNEEVTRIQLGSLLSHLCHEHHFLEGVDCAFRVDPQQFIDLFELKKEKELNGTINADWFAGKVKRDKIAVHRVIDPIPTIMKFMSGVAGLEYSS